MPLDFVENATVHCYAHSPPSIYTVHALYLTTLIISYLSTPQKQKQGVFAVTGSSTVMVVKPILKEVFQLEGSMKEGPWSFRFAYLCTTLPLYSCVLLTVATVAGRRPYFKKVVLRMWGRFLPKKVIQRFQ
ncbi:MAG: hypothetical protein JOS17DRAFT_561024 [Linnemannia elongata]|nr:MAG: hypothetical protein JOS17DRAFT_561024 [Linnemannia elongata]